MTTMEVPEFRATSAHSYRSASTFLSLTPTPTPEPHGLAPRPSFSRNLSLAPGGLPCDENTPAQYGRQLKVESNGQHMYSPNRARTLSTVSAVSNATWWSAVASIQTQEGITEVTPAHPPTDHYEANNGDEIQPAKKTDSGFSSSSAEDDRYRPDSGGVASLSSHCSYRPRTHHSSRHRENDRPQSNASRTIISANPRLSRQDTSTSASSATATNNKSRSRRPSTSHNARVSTSTGYNYNYDASPLPSPGFESSRPCSSAAGLIRLVPASSASDQPWDWDWNSVHTNSVHRMPRRGSIDQGPVRKNVSERLRSASAYTRSSETLFQTASHSPRPRNVSLAGTTSTGATAIPPPVDGEDPTQPQTIAWKNLDSLRAEYAAADRRHKSPWGWIRRRILCGAGLLGCGGNQAEFWEEGDEDRGSVRRYRLALPSEGNVGEVVRMVGEDRVEKVPVGWVRGVEREKGG